MMKLMIGESGSGTFPLTEEELEELNSLSKKSIHYGDKVFDFVLEKQEKQ